MSSLREAFVAGVAERPDAPPQPDALPGLDAWLQDAIASAHETHPDLDVSDEAFARYIGARVPDVDTTLPALAFGDLYLACACAHGDPRGLVRFDALYGADLDRAARRNPQSDLTPDEFRQRVRERLFVTHGDDTPKIGAYHGQGTLRGWIRVTAVRLLIDLGRRASDPASRGKAVLVEGLADQAHSPELRAIRDAYRESFPAALQTAFEGLTIRQRNLLRQRYLHEVAPNALADLYGVHRATLFRWIDGARKGLLDGTRAALGAALRLSPAELDSVMALAYSQLDLSVRGLMNSQLEDESGGA